MYLPIWELSLVAISMLFVGWYVIQLGTFSPFVGISLKENYPTGQPVGDES